MVGPVKDLTAGELQRPDYAAINPNMKAPTLIDDGLVLWESSAIMAHLCHKAGSDLWPADDPHGLIEILRWLSWNDNHWAPAVSPYQFEFVTKPTFGLGPPDEANLEGKAETLERYAKVLEAHLRSHSHPALDRLTIADFQMASMATDWRVSRMPLQAYPAIIEWLDRMQEISAWRDPWPT